MDCFKRCRFVKAVVLIITGCVAWYLLMYAFKGSSIHTSPTLTGNEPIDDMDLSTDPCKDFYQYACGGFLKNNPHREDFKRLGRFQVAVHREQIEINRLVLLEPDPNDIKPILKMKSFVKTCLDADKNEETEISSLKNLLNEIGGWQLLDKAVGNASDFDWVKASVEVRRSTENSAIINLDVALTSELEAELAINKPTFGLPIQYLTSPSLNNEALQKYANFIYYVATQLGSIRGEDELQKAILDIINFEIRLAKIVQLANGSRKTAGTLNFMPISSRNLTIKFVEFVTSPYGLVTEPEKIWVHDYNYFDFLASVLEKESNETIANYVVWRFVSGLISEATPSLYKIKQRFDGESVEAVGREYSCVLKANSPFRGALRWKYMEDNIDLGTKQEFENMTRIILEAAKTTLEEVEGISSEVKGKCLKRLEGIIVISVEEREAVEKYFEGPELGESYMENQVRINKFLFGKELLDIKGGSNEAALYGLGAKYHPFYNSIQISPALLQPPFFGSRFKHQNYAKLGFYIAHEIAHALQMTPPIPGRKRKTECLGELGFQKNFKGSGQTFDEDIADVYGLRISWRAYQDYVAKHGQEEGIFEPGLENFTSAHLFFLGHANAHCESITPEALAEQIKTDPHSPAKIRVNEPFKHFEEFAKAFNCPVDVN